eukprot:TRINITY_DN12683_c0_g2_i4.p1 TRINITY_DN12683_c0_g2~~TRINITY_DN12683_c0_g2_i4.p1  ORF type:complete len:558 (+),score=103.06 TRINITY_DN12683_c0_g2_i4:72-1745(+)
MVDLQVLLAERDAEFSDQLQVGGYRFGEVHCGPSRLRGSDVLTRSLVEASEKIEQLSSDRDRAADGRRAARMDARRAEAARCRAQRSFGAAVRRAEELSRRLAAALRECKRVAVRAEAAHVASAYWRQRALSAEGRLRAAQNRRGVLEQQVRDGSAYLGAASSPTQRTPLRDTWGSPEERTLPRSPSPAVSSAGDSSRACPRVAQVPFRLGANVVLDFPTVVARWPPGAGASTTALAAFGQEFGLGGSACPAFDCPMAAKEVAPLLHHLGFACASASVQQGEQVGRERCSVAAAQQSALLLLNGAQGRELFLRQQALADQEAAMMQRENLERAVCRTAAALELTQFLSQIHRLRAAAAELQLLPHSEVAQRGRVEMAESEAGRDLLSSVCQALAPGARAAAAGSSHPDAGWFLTLNVISFSIASFAPRRWAPVCRKAAAGVYCVHKHWLSAAKEVHWKMVSRLTTEVAGPEEERFGWAIQEWDDLIRDAGGDVPEDQQNNQRILLMHCKSALNYVERLELDLEGLAQAMRHMAARNRSATAAIEAILGSELLGEQTD